MLKSLVFNMFLFMKTSQIYDQYDDVPSFPLHPEWFMIPEYKTLDSKERFQYTEAVIRYGLYRERCEVPEKCRAYFEATVIPTLETEKWEKNRFDLN